MFVLKMHIFSPSLKLHLQGQNWLMLIGSKNACHSMHSAIIKAILYLNWHSSNALFCDFFRTGISTMCTEIYLQHCMSFKHKRSTVE